MADRGVAFGRAKMRRTRAELRSSHDNTIGRYRTWRAPSRAAGYTGIAAAALLTRAVRHHAASVSGTARAIALSKKVRQRVLIALQGDLQLRQNLLHE